MFLLLGLAAAALCGCGRRDNDVEDQGPELLYQKRQQRHGRVELRRRRPVLQALEARYPFSPETRQAQLDLIYLYYRSQQPESAIDAAEQFVRENPTHARSTTASTCAGSSISTRRRTSSSAVPRRSIAAAAEGHDALVLDVPGADPPVPEQRVRARMRASAWSILRNRLAEYENYVADYYIQRGAYVAADQPRQVRARALPRSAAARADARRSWSTPTRGSAWRTSRADARRVLAETFARATASDHGRSRSSVRLPGQYPDVIG